jgi:hypothetical protein
VVARFVTELKAGISDPRLERYRRPAGASDLDMLTNYFWNMALADALHCSLSVAEILLRNAIHDTLRAHFGQDDWYERDDLLEEGQRQDRDKAKHHIETRGRTVTPERVVSQLTFGFWVTLLSSRYNERFWRPDLASPPNLRRAFPHAPAKSRRNDIQAKYYAANNLRNLAFHHEPIFDLRSLLDDYRRVHEGIAWIDPSMSAKIQIFDRFPDVLTHGRPAVEAALRDHFGP